MPGRAVPALQGVVLVEGLLHWMKLPVSCEPLDRRDLDAVGLDASIVQDFTDSPFTSTVQAPHEGGIAADVRPGQPQSLSEYVHEQLARLQLELVPHVVDGQRYPSQGSPPFLASGQRERTPRVTRPPGERRAG